ncbi:zinc ribbon domain-containing protein [Halobacteriales archaeon Cl-PHB]
MPYCPSCGGPIDEGDVVCDHCGDALRPDGTAEAVTSSVRSTASANGHAEATSVDAGPFASDSPDGGRRMLLKAFGGLGLLVGAAAVLSGGDGSSASQQSAGGQTGSDQPPMASFGFDFDGGAGQLTVTHDGGEAIPVTELFLQGSNVGREGAWDSLGGSASGTAQGGDAVVAGDEVDLRVRSDYVLSVIWESQDGDRSAELARDRGPEA